MTVSNDSIEKITDKLSKEVLNEIVKSEEWIELVYDKVDEVVSKKIGNIDEELLLEMSFLIHSKLTIHSIS